MAEHDDLVRMRAEMDQSREELREIGRALRGLFDGLVEAGFNEEQALGLTGTYLTQLISAAPAREFINRLFGDQGDEA